MGKLEQPAVYTSGMIPKGSNFQNKQVSKMSSEDMIDNLDEYN